MLSSVMLHAVSTRALLVLALAALSVGSGSSLAVAAEQPTLKETLENGLKARRPEEFAFIEKVVRLVDQGKLPRSLVEGTYVWARRQHAVPFPYFESGLRARAKRIGVVL